MTGKQNQTRKKASAVFFAFVMVTSMVAIGFAGFAGSSAALSGSDVTVASDPVVLGGQDEPLGDSSQAFNITESSNNEFGSSGTAAITLPDGVTFNQSSSNLQFRQVSSGSISNVRFTDSQTLEFDYSGFDSGQNDSILFSRLNIAVASDTGSNFDVDIRVGATSTTKNIATASASVSEESTVDINRGQQGVGSLQVNVDGGASDGLHQQGENITITIPDSQQDRIAFDTSQDVTVSDGNGDVTGGDTVTPTATTISFNATAGDLDQTDEVDVTGINFNTTGVSDDTVDPTFTSALDVTTVPSSGQTVTQQTASDTVNVEAPTASLGSAVILTPGVDKQDSSSDIIVSDDTDSGGAIADGTNVTVSIPENNGITFDTEQSATGSQGGQISSVGTPYFEDDKTVTVSVTGDSDGTASGTDTVTFSTGSGGIQFNASSDAEVTDLNLTAETTPTTTGAESIVRNTSTGNTNYINTESPTLNTDGAGNDVLIANDDDGETSVSLPNANPALTLTSNSNGGDLSLDQGSGTNITVTIPESSGLEFDQSSGVSTGSGNFGGTSTPTIVDAKTLNITTDDTSISDGNTIQVDDLDFNVTGGTSDNVKLSATVNRTGDTFESQNYINTTVVDADTLESDADNNGGFGATGDGETTVDVTVGETQTSALELTNSSGTGDPALSGYGGADVNLEVTDAPDSGSVSDVTLNTSSVTTDQDGQAVYNATLTDSARTGTYNVTASLASNENVNVTTQYTGTAGEATQFNVSGVDNAVIDQSGLSGSPSETETAAYRVRIEDSGGNLVGDQAVDVNVQVSNGELQTVTDQIANNGDSTGTVVDDNGDNDRRDYQPSGDHSADTTKGDFYVFVSSTSPGDVDVTVSEGGISDTGTATIFDAVGGVDIEANDTSPAPDSSVGVTATAQTSDGTTVEVPRLTLNDLSSDNTTVLERATLSEESNGGTFANGTVEGIFNAKAVGTANVTADIAGSSATQTIEVVESSGEPAPGQVQIENVNLDPSSVTSDTQNDHTLTFDATNVSDDGNTDDFTVTIPDAATLESANSVSVVDANGSNVSLSGGPDQSGNTIEFDVAPDSSADTRDLTVTADVTVTAPNVSEETTADITIDVSDSDNGDDSATTTLTIQPEDAVTGPEIPGVDQDLSNAVDANDDGQVDRDELRAAVQGYVQNDEVNGVAITRGDLRSIVQYYVQN